MRNNPAYYQIKAPTQLASRLLLEDIPTGLVPFVALGEVAGLEMPLTRSLIHISSALLRRDFWSYGRTLHALGLDAMNVEAILEYVQR
jgi:opine dehydrogenase